MPNFREKARATGKKEGVKKDPKTLGTMTQIETPKAEGQKYPLAKSAEKVTGGKVLGSGGARNLACGTHLLPKKKGKKKKKEGPSRKQRKRVG